MIVILYMDTLQNQGPTNPNGPQMSQKPDNYLVWAILSTVLCCVPLGIVAIVKSSKVDSLWLNGNYAESIQAANDAKKWALISAGAGIAGVVIYGIVMLIAIALG